MKIILSRKGFDSDFGGHPSVILPDGKLISFPIPTNRSRSKRYLNKDFFYKDLKIDNEPYLDIFKSLGYKEYSEDSTCHLDPDLYPKITKRSKEWRGVFGQVGSAQSHLENYDIKPGDLFLFFGWFKRTEYDSNGHLKLSKKDSDKHVIFGYLQIGEILRLCEQSILFEENIPEWIKYHPHTSSELRKYSNNTVYLARESLSWDSNLPGSGTFTYSDKLVLTKEGCTRTIWNLPDFMKEIDISYHSPKNWTENGFKSVSRGQEFVISEDERVEQWAKEVISKGTKVS